MACLQVHFVSVKAFPSIDLRNCSSVRLTPSGALVSLNALYDLAMYQRMACPWSSWNQNSARHVDSLQEAAHFVDPTLQRAGSSSKIEFVVLLKVPK